MTRCIMRRIVPTQERVPRPEGRMVAHRTEAMGANEGRVGEWDVIP